MSASAVREGLLAVRRHGEQGRLGGEKRFYPWLSVIASRLCIDVARRRARSKPVDAEALSLVSGGTESPEEVLASKWDEAELLDAVGRLPRRHREVLALRALGDWPYERIASHSGMSIAGVKSLIWRARSALREELAEAPGLRARIGALGLVGGGIPRLVVGKRRACAHLANLLRQAGYARRAATVNAAGVVALAALALGTGILAGTSSGQAGEKATGNPARSMTVYRVRPGASHPASSVSPGVESIEGSPSASSGGVPTRVLDKEAIEAPPPVSVNAGPVQIGSASQAGREAAAQPIRWAAMGVVAGSDPLGVVGQALHRVVGYPQQVASSLLPKSLLGIPVGGAGGIRAP